jgi:integrase
MPLGQFGGVSLADARKAARIRLGEISAGRDPQAERREATRREDARLDHALDAYEKHLKRRQIVNRGAVMSLLRRSLFGPVGKVDLATLDRQTVAKQIDRLEQQGQPGAAQDLRAKVMTFLNWATNQGLVFANPLAGWRRERTTRAQVLRRTGHVLSDEAIRSAWTGCDAVEAPFGDYVWLLLLLGQRRTETALMEWDHVDLDAGVWTIPPANAKNGREHRVPLPAQAVEIIAGQPRWEKSPYVFTGRNKRAMTGWSKRMPDLLAASGVTFTLHDLRRTFRGGLTRLALLLTSQSSC